jgi:hypothetical protein
MPYVTQNRREELDSLTEELTWAIRRGDLDLAAGDLNYLFTQIMLATRPARYADYNALIGMLECCKLELYRRAVATYEDKKINENGDVYPVSSTGATIEPPLNGDRWDNEGGGNVK